MGFPIPDHDYEALKHFLGQPMRVGPFLAFANATVLSLCTVPTMPLPCSIDTIDIPGLIDQQAFDQVHLWGWELNQFLSSLTNFERISFRLGTPDDRLLRIVPSEYAADRRARLHRADRLLSAGEIAVEEGIVRPITEYESLLQLVNEKISSRTDRLFHETFTSMARASGTRVFSAISRSELVGFLATRQLTPDYAYLGWTACRRQPRYVSDILYKVVIQYFVERNIVYDLGCGRTPSLFSYKMKWSPTTLLPPLRYASLRRRARAGR